jgi:hypothetical protein
VAQVGRLASELVREVAEDVGIPFERRVAVDEPQRPIVGEELGEPLRVVSIPSVVQRRP